tara:strand:- start:122 stop:814 length:693 start_codon:yes stop_codon:yes gene_type:complete
MLETNGKAANKSFKFFKSFLPCYGAGENRFFESHPNFSGEQAILSFGYKHEIKTPRSDLKFDSSSNVVYKITDFETPYNEMSADVEPYRKIRTENELFKLFQEIFESKTFLKGRLLNTAKKGFSVGACGLVGFLPSTNVVQVEESKTMILQIESVNLRQGIVSFSQKNICKKTHKVLAKLASKISFIFEANSKTRQFRGFQGEHSSVVRALNCDFKSREFKSHCSPTVKK